MEHLELTNNMIVSGTILVLTFIGIFTEHLHGFARSKFALLGAGFMMGAGLLFDFYTPDLAVEAVDWNVIFLLGCMMTIVTIMIPTGGFNALASWLAVKSHGKPYLMLVLLGTAVTLISLLLDNVTTVVIFGPLIILIARTLGISPVPTLMAAALLSDTGGVATLVGDPPNLMIGSAAHIDFNTFVIRMWFPVLVAWIGILIALKFLFRKELAIKPKTTDIEQQPVTNPRIWKASLVVMGIMVVLFTIHDKIGWEPWMVSAFGLTLLLFIGRSVILDHALEEVEFALLIFFISLFILIGGVEQTHFLEYIGQIIKPLVSYDLLLATIVLMWVSAVLSAAIDNIPFTAAMIPILLGMEAQGVNVTPLWWGLAVGVGMGGNGTHIGSTANVYIVTISERLARQENNPALRITPGTWFKTGTPAMLLTLVLASIVFIAFFPFFAAPIH
jgi:Na+/H+ antiporter NhaD/arsenite permease-like protein